MKQLLFIITLLFSFNLSFGQAKKPTLMIVPSDNWCISNGYLSAYYNQGTIEKYPNYKRAFQENSDLLLVISTLNGLMAERGFPLKNMETVLKSLEIESTEDGMLVSKEGGEISESPIDMLNRTAKADIILQVTWTINQTGPKKSITFNLQGLDSYTNKQIATAAGTGAQSLTAEVPVLLEEAVVSHIDSFTGTLQTYFDDLFTNGREITLRIKVWDTWGEDLESEFGDDGDELGELIEYWLDENTVNGRYSTSDATENMMVFEQVRIPMFYKRKGKEVAMDTRKFAKKLNKYLKAEPFLIPSKVMTKGLGSATIVLGGK